MRHLIRVLRRHDLTNKKTMTKTNTNTNTNTKTNTNTNTNIEKGSNTHTPASLCRAALKDRTVLTPLHERIN